MMKAALIAVIASYFWFNALGAAVGESQWRTFTSRTGWSIEFSANWSTASCRSCPDPHAPGMYVDFFPPANQDVEGWVMVSPLTSKPKSETEDEWLKEIAAGANLNPQLNSQKTTVAGLPALRVRYRTSDGSLMEAVYVVAERQTFSIDFNGDGLRGSLDLLPRYAIYNKMIESFSVNLR
jgi:hypothetical protein